MNLRTRIISEFLGTFGLLMIVVGSGIMGENLAQGNLAIALLANSIATGTGLFVLIETFGSISGAHFNPVVSLIECLNHNLSKKELFFYILSQILGAIAGVWVTHLMFGKQVFQLSTHDRGDLRFVFSEFIATCGLILVISLSNKRKSNSTSFLVAAYITSAYWYTSSTSFANPAVTIARSMTNTFSGIQWTGAPNFILAQFCGGIVCFAVINFFKLSNV